MPGTTTKSFAKKQKHQLHSWLKPKPKPVAGVKIPTRLAPKMCGRKPPERKTPAKPPHILKGMIHG